MYSYVETAIEWAEGDKLIAVAVPYNGLGQAGEISSLIFEVGGVGLKDVQQGVIISVYPNPATDYIQIIGLKGMQKVEIFNTSGQIVYSKDAMANGLRVNVNNFAQGTYFVKVTANGKVVTKQIIVK